MNEGLSTKDVKKLNKASILSTSTNPKDQDRARARQTEVDYKDLVRQLKAKRKKKEVKEATTSRYTSIAAKANTAIKDVERKEKLKRINKTMKAMRKHRDFHPLLHNPKGGATTADLRGEEVEAKESFEIDKTAHKSAQRKAKLRNLAKGNANPNEKAAAEKKAGGPKLIGERLGGKGYKPRKDYAGRTVSGDWEDSDRGAGNKATRRAGGKVKKKSPTYQAYVLNKEEVVSEGKTFDAWKKAAAKALGKKKEERTAQKAMDAGARLRRKKQRQEYAAKISGSEDNVPDEMRD